MDGVQLISRARRREAEIRRLRAWQRRRFYTQLQEQLQACVCMSCCTFTAAVVGWSSMAAMFPGLL